MGSPERSVLEGAVDCAASLRRPIRIAFVITGLELGGAEMMLWKLLTRMDRTRFEPCVLVLNSEEDGMLPAFRQLDAPCEMLGLRPGWRALFGLHRLSAALKKYKPDLIQGWMYHANLAASLTASRIQPRVPVLWNIRATIMDRRQEKGLTALLIWLGGKFSSSPVRIINNSNTSALEHERLGYSTSNGVILPNGFDTERFSPRQEARQELRKSLGLDEDAMLIGLVARYHPMKDHRNFLHAASIVKAAHPRACFVLAGESAAAGNPELTAVISECRLSQSVYLLGRRDDMHLVSAAFDILVSSSSSGEGFPNVVGEAMSCGVSCVVTDVGDCKDVVADTGLVVEPRNAAALAGAITRLIDGGSEMRHALGLRARRRVLDKYSLDSIVRQYEALYAQVYIEHTERSI
jgi:glycosyltransferase involved in cell wall biosynthesis